MISNGFLDFLRDSLPNYFIISQQALEDMQVSSAIRAVRLHHRRDGTPSEWDLVFISADLP
jgi:hypothetical protein